MSKKGIVLIVIFSAVLVTAIVLAVLLPNSQPPQSFAATELEVFGTYFSARLFYQDKSLEQVKQDFDELTAALRTIESQISANETRYPQSDIVLFNKLQNGETVRVGEHTAKLIKECAQLYQDTQGAFNPAIYYALDFWGFGDKYGAQGLEESQPWLHAQELAALYPISDFSGVKLIEQGGYYLKKECEPVLFRDSLLELRIDLGGVGKGYAIDYAVEFLTERGYTDGFVSLGGSSIGLLNNPLHQEGLWQIDLINPRSEQTASTYYGSVELSGCAVSASGDYQNYYIQDQVRYCHILAPDLTPISNGCIMLSLVTQSALYGDALSTALLVLGESAPSFCQAFGEKYGIISYAAVFEQGDSYSVRGSLKPQITNGWYEQQ